VADTRVFLRAGLFLHPANGVYGEGRGAHRAASSRNKTPPGRLDGLTRTAGRGRGTLGGAVFFVCGGPRGNRWGVPARVGFFRPGWLAGVSEDTICRR